MTDPSLPSPDDAPRLVAYLELLPCTSVEAAEEMGVSTNTVKGYRERLRKHYDIEFEYDHSSNEHSLAVDLPGLDSDHTQSTRTEELASLRDDLETVDVGEDPDPSDLTDRERYVARELQTGATLDELREDLGERDTVITQHLRNLRREGWRVYIDDSAEHVAIEGDHTLRSSEHRGTRTRKANRWWEQTHNAIQRQWKQLDPTDVSLTAKPGNEDWVTHLTDLHAGDVVRDYAGDIVYETDHIPDVVEYITEQSIALSEKHNATYDTAHLLYGGDLVTNEAIYSGQFEDLDAWLDEQAQVIQDALIEQILTFSEHFDTVNVVGQIGNHGVNRANGTSKHNNADLLVYKALRTFITKSQQHFDRLENVRVKIGEARPYTPIRLRGGEIHGQLRHGQHRKPQAETSARLKEWLSTLLDTINSSWGAFDVAWMGHHHVSGRIPWNGPPILVSGSPKPGGDYVEEIGEKGQSTQPSQIAHCHGVSDDGVTSIWPVDTRNYQHS
jgi:DNA-binding CsgD family transcriptional regulator